MWTFNFCTVLKSVHLKYTLSGQSKQAISKKVNIYTHGHVQCSSIRVGLLTLTQEFSVYSQEVLDFVLYIIESSKMMLPITYLVYSVDYSCMFTSQ